MIEETDYQNILKSAFSCHYQESSDKWTEDAELRSIPSLIQGYLKLVNNNLEVLDLGCGAGKDVEYFAKLGNSVLGLDICHHDNWETIKSFFNRVDFICNDFMQVKLEPKFNLILDSGCFHHQHPNHYVKYLNKIYSLLSIDGDFVISTFKSNDNHTNIDNKGRLHKHFDDIELNHILTSCDFEIVNQIDIYRIKKKEYYRLTFSRKR